MSVIQLPDKEFSFNLVKKSIDTGTSCVSKPLGMGIQNPTTGDWDMSSIRVDYVSVSVT